MKNEKIKQWLSDRNNNLLIQDIIFVFALAFSFIIFLVGCQSAIPIAKADEIITMSETEATEALLPKMTLPKLPDLSQTEDLPLNFTDFKAVLSFNSNKNIYAVIGRAKTMGSKFGSISLSYSTPSPTYISFGHYQLVYGDTYKLQNGKWELLNSYTGTSVKIEDNITSESYNYGYTYNNCLLYSTLTVGMSDSGGKNTKTLTPAADVTFSGSYVPSKPSGPSEIDTSTSIGSFSSDVVKTGSSLFDVAGEAVKFIVKNPICLIGAILFVFCAATGITKNFIRGV